MCVCTAFWGRQRRIWKEDGKVCLSIGENRHLPFGAIVVGRRPGLLNPDFLDLVKDGAAGSRHCLDFEVVAFAGHSSQVASAYSDLSRFPKPLLQRNALSKIEGIFT